MRCRVILTEAARADITDALDWCAQHAPYSMPALCAELRAVFTRIAANPL